MSKKGGIGVYVFWIFIGIVLGIFIALRFICK